MSIYYTQSTVRDKRLMETYVIRAELDPYQFPCLHTVTDIQSPVSLSYSV